jgi:hypothetical protein
MMSLLGPMGMIFVPSVGGISHSPKELSTWEDCARGTDVLLQTVRRRGLVLTRRPTRQEGLSYAELWCCDFVIRTLGIVNSTAPGSREGNILFRASSTRVTRLPRGDILTFWPPTGRTGGSIRVHGRIRVIQNVRRSRPGSPMQILNHTLASDGDGGVPPYHRWRSAAVAPDRYGAAPVRSMSPGSRPGGSCRFGVLRCRFIHWSGADTTVPEDRPRSPGPPSESGHPRGDRDAFSLRISWCRQIR